jgi:hypothetical protein
VVRWLLEEFALTFALAAIDANPLHSRWSEVIGRRARVDATAIWARPSLVSCPFAATQQLASVPTRLASMEPDVQERLINWGYAICDAAMRKHVVTAAAAPQAFPYPQPPLTVGS